MTVSLDTARAPLGAARDRACVAGQLGRAPHPFARVAARCPWGLPAVVENLPYDQHGRPFPTLFYATCPTLVAAVAAVESGGGVQRFGERVRTNRDWAAALAAAERRERRRRRDLARRASHPMRDGGRALEAGIGGVACSTARLTSPGGVLGARRGSLKCLHAHGAHALAHPGYLVGEAVLAEAGELWCADERCRAFVAGGPDGATAGRRSGRR